MKKKDNCFMADGSETTEEIKKSGKGKKPGTVKRSGNKRTAGKK